MSTAVFLVRHAAHVDLGRRLSGRRDPVPLSPEGVDQTRRLTARMASADLAAVYSSPLDRACATAAAVAAPAGLKVAIAPALDEIDFGAWTGRSFDELGDDPGWVRWNHSRGSARAPGGEGMVAAQVRAVGHVEHVARLHGGSAVALVSHADIIRAIIAHYLGLPLDHLLRFDVDPASVSTMLVGPWGARIVTLNEKVAA